MLWALNLKSSVKKIWLGLQLVKRRELVPIQQNFLSRQFYMPLLPCKWFVFGSHTHIFSHLWLWWCARVIAYAFKKCENRWGKNLLKQNDLKFCFFCPNHTSFKYNFSFLIFVLPLLWIYIHRLIIKMFEFQNRFFKSFSYLCMFSVSCNSC